MVSELLHWVKVNLDDVTRARLLEEREYHHMKSIFQQTPVLNQPMLEEIAKLFEFRNYKSILEPIFKDLLLNGKYRRPLAMYILLLLDLDGEDLIYPLLLPSILSPGERTPEVFKFLDKYPITVRRLFAVVDDLIQGPAPPADNFKALKNTQQVVAEYHDDINCSAKLVKDTLLWLVKKLPALNLYSITAMSTWNRRTVEFFVRMAAGGRISGKTLRSKIQSVIRANDVQLQCFLISQLSLYGNMYSHISFYMAQYELDETTVATFPEVEETWGPKKPFVDTFPVYAVRPGIILKVVDNRETFIDMLEHLRHIRIIGIAGRLQGMGNTLLVLQIAIKDHIFIVDAFEGNFPSDLWARLVYKLNKMDWIIGNSVISKLLAVPEFIGVSCKYLNMVKFFNHLRNEPRYNKYLGLSERLPFPRTMKPIVRMLLRSHWNDEPKLCDFTERPLHQDVVNYLGLSALGVYDCFYELRYRFKKCEETLEGIAANWIGLVSPAVPSKSDASPPKSVEMEIDFTSDDFF